ncbi:MAG: hypothetical protein A3D95_03015 [Betaproteobacteria bacterium RIFCSPHIGHO2_12_FULL_69_13]|nr:MAG: hypothetical protein A3D95_03015 [Betaproteobacteria bacterium RIFCSPHIGHO2_12_FULL_69_13]
MIRFRWLLVFLWSGLASAQALSGAALVDELRKGSYVLYLRHTSTDFSQNDRGMRSYEDCSTQRNLSDKGRDEAREIARQLKRLRVARGPVLASPMCRTMETARLAFGKADASSEVRGGSASPDDPKRYEPLRRLLSREVPKKENRLIASHGNPFRAVAGPPHLAEGEIAVVRPRGDGFEIAARLRVEDWAVLPD